MGRVKSARMPSIVGLAAVLAVTGAGFDPVDSASATSAARQAAGTARSASSASAATGPATSAAKAQLTAAVSVNPVTGNQGFNVFVAGNATLNSTSIGGPVALGGNLTLGSGSFNVATQSAGTFTASGLTPGRPGSSSTAASTGPAAARTASVDVQNNGFVKVGDMTGSAVAQSRHRCHRCRPSGTGRALRRRESSRSQPPTASVNQSGWSGFSSAFRHVPARDPQSPTSPPAPAP